MSNPDYGNVPAQPVYGEVKEIEEQQAAAPLPAGELAPTPATAPAPTPTGEVAPPAEAPTSGPGRPNPGNIVDVLPPPNTSPAYSGQRPLGPEQELAYLILGTDGMSGLARSFASQIVGKYRRDAGLPEQQLGPQALSDYRVTRASEQMPTETEE